MLQLVPWLVLLSLALTCCLLLHCAGRWWWGWNSCVRVPEVQPGMRGMTTAPVA